MSQSYRLNDCIVAVLDLLGAKEKIQKGESERIISALHSVYDQTIATIQSQDEEFLVRHPFKFKTFSDNIAIVIPFGNCNNGNPVVDNDSNNDDKPDNNLDYNPDLSVRLEKIAHNISTFQLKLWCNHGLFFRGGLSAGKCYIDDQIVLGEGLIDAYEIESTLSIYPRVVVSSKLVKAITRYPIVRKEFNQDFDGSYYVDYFSNWIISYPSAEKRQPHIDEVQKNLKEAQNDKIRQKYLWMMEKINSIESK